MKTKERPEWIQTVTHPPVNFSKLMGERDWCFYIPPQHGECGFIPAVVIDHVQGYRMLSGNGDHARPWYWGRTEAEANEICRAKNSARDITPERAQEIVLSSMGDYGQQ